MTRLTFADLRGACRQKRIFYKAEDDRVTITLERDRVPIFRGHMVDCMEFLETEPDDPHRRLTQAEWSEFVTHCNATGIYAVRDWDMFYLDRDRKQIWGPGSFEEALAYVKSARKH